MDATERARLRALCEAATPGPWDAIYDEDAGEWTVRTGHADVAVLTWQQALDALGLSPVTMRTAAFIAASRTAIPALLDDSERLDAVTRERDEARAEAERLRTGLGYFGGRDDERIDALESALRASLARWRAARGRFDPRPDCDVCGVRLAADGAETHDAECAVGRDLRVLGGGAT